MSQLTSSPGTRDSQAERPKPVFRKKPEVICAEDFLQRMVSNDVAANDVCEALLLTPKARIIAPLRVLKRAPDDFLLLTEPELGDVVRTQLMRARFAAKVENSVRDYGDWNSSYDYIVSPTKAFEEAMHKGVFGSPFFIVDGEPFWGNDRLAEVREWLQTGGW